MRPQASSIQHSFVPPLWRHRGYLPHFDGACTQMITFRLRDSMPKQVLTVMQQKLDAMPLSEAKRQKQSVIDEYLDSGYGDCVLAMPEVAEIVEGVILRHDGRRYDAHAWVVMPNHVHALITLYKENTLGSIVHSWKVRSAKRINFQLSRKGPLWYRDYFDRYMRSEAHFERSVDYIEMNPVEAGLCKYPEDWRFSSAQRESRYDERSPDFNPVIVDRFIASLPSLR
jgi:REP element-mobilizing transposase RayT